MKYLFVILSIFCNIISFGQGCSDAGFCSILNTMPTMARPDKKLHNIRFSSSIGQANHKVMAMNSAIEYSRWISNTMTINTRVNFLAHFGNSIHTGEIGDIYLTGDFKISPKLTAVTGFKVPLRNGDKVKKGITLPMEYQPSLGTLDFLFALQTHCDKWDFAVGYQQPLTQNSNSFFSNNFISSDPNEVFQTTNGFRRNPDAWFRVSYHLDFDKISIVPSLLPIYHLANDSYMDSDGSRKFIMGSKGLTLNGALQLDYKITKNDIIGFNGALPFIIRDARPDGLTRTYNITLDLRHSF